ncbi:MAG: DNRLRE domain-containing protein [Chthoniobacterales bacterium]
MKNIKSAVMVLLLAGAAFNAKADLTTVTTADGNGADAYVQGGSAANTSFGTSADLFTGTGGSADQVFKTYFRFDISNLTIDTSPFATPAVLSFTTIDTLSNTGFSLYLVKDGTAGDLLGGWDETNITYNNAPANDIAGGGLLNSGSILLGSFNLNALSGHTVAIGLNPAVLSTDTNGLLTFALVRTSSGLQPDFASKENNSPSVAPPSLTVPTVVVEAVPEPAEIVSAVAFLAAIGGLYLGKKRKSALQAQVA